MTSKYQTDLIFPISRNHFLLIYFLLKYYKERFYNKYDINKEITNPYEIIDEIARLRGCIIQNNEIDYERVYKLILTDIRNDGFGGLTFDRFI